MNKDSDIAASVAKNSWTAVSVTDCDVPFAYTVGLMFSWAHPELIVFGLRDQGYLILSDMAYLIKGGVSFAKPGLYEGVICDYAVATRRVHSTQHELYLGYAMGYCREQGRIGELDAVQVFWPDKAGRFPFDAGCDQTGCSLQPRLDLPVSPSDLDEWRRRMGTL